MEGWYADGTQVVFACGGGIWTSALDAAETHDGKVIGVDVDQRSKIGERCLTSAMKGLPSAINNALDSYFSGNFSELGGTAQQLGLKDGDYIGLPTDSESWGFTTFTQDQYETVLAGIRDGSIEISSDTENQPEVGSHVTVDYILLGKRILFLFPFFSVTQNAILDIMKARSSALFSMPSAVLQNHA